MSNPGKFSVHLTTEQRKQLRAFTQKGQHASRVILLSQALLLCDEDHAEGQRPDTYIVAALGIKLRTLVRLRKQFVERGLEAALQRKVRSTPPVAPKITGRVQAHPGLLESSCRTFQLVDALAGWRHGAFELYSFDQQRIGASGSQKNELKPWLKQRFCIAEADRSRFVAQMEQVLDTYEIAPSEEEPLIAARERRPYSCLSILIAVGVESVRATPASESTGQKRCVICWK
jgi:hypothetical protein